MERNCLSALQTKAWFTDAMCVQAYTYNLYVEEDVFAGSTLSWFSLRCEDQENEALFTEGTDVVGLLLF